MGSDCDDSTLEDKIDQFLSEELDDYEPPSEEDIEEWREKSPHPSEAVKYDSMESDEKADP